MAHVLQGALVRAPAAASHADQAVVFAFDALDDAVRLAEHGPEARAAGCAVGVVGDALPVRGLGVEGVGHVFASQLAEGAGFEAEEFEHCVEFGDVCCWRKVRELLVSGVGSVV